MNPVPDNDDSLVISYLELRKVIGILGILLPFVVSVGAWLIFETPLQKSISLYYYTGTRNIFVGTLWALGFFFFSYKGYDRRDDIAGSLAFTFALGASLFPTAPDCDPCSYSHIANALHNVFAGLLFLTLSYFSLALFTQTDPSKTPTRQKLQRNVVYKVCGYAMLVCIVLIIPMKVVPSLIAPANEYDLIFWLETITIVAFGFSWLTKGEAILSDQS